MNRETEPGMQPVQYLVLGTTLPYQLHTHSHAFAAANANGSHTSTQATLPEGAHQGHDDPRARTPDRVPQRDGASAGVHHIMSQVKFGHKGHRHDGKRLVDLPEIDVRNRPVR